MTASYYDEYWSDPDNPRTVMVPGLVAFLEGSVDSSMSVLDVGCGDGRGPARILNQRAGSYIGVDVSRPAVERAQAAGIDVRLIEDASTLPFDDATFDAVVSVEVLEHLFAPHAAAAEFARVLKPGGRFFGTVPNTAYWRRRVELAMFGRFNPIGDDESSAKPWRDPHIRFFTKRTLSDMFASAGFEVDEIGGHEGSLLPEIPGIRRWSRPGPSTIYGALERSWPALFALRLHIRATRSAG